MSPLRVWAYAAVVGVTACGEPAAETTPAAPMPRGAVDGAWPAAIPSSTFGRGIAPQRASRAAITGSDVERVRALRVIAVQGDGDPLAVVEGTALALVDVDAGAPRWTIAAEDCTGTGRVRRADRTQIVCSSGTATAGLGLDGKPRWRDPRPLGVVDAQGVLVIAGAGELVPIDPGGAAADPIAVPNQLAARVRARCGDELWAAAGGRLIRLDHRPTRVPSRRRRPATTVSASQELGEMWSIDVGEAIAIDPCNPIVVVATAPRPVSMAPETALTPAPPSIALVDRTPTMWLHAIDHLTGDLIGGPIAARGYWPARDGSSDLEIATAAGIEQRPRSLAPGRVINGSPVVGGLLDRRGHRRLVAGPPVTTVLGGDLDAGPATTIYLLDDAGVRALISGSVATGALGEQSILAATDPDTGDRPALVRFQIPTERPAQIPIAPTFPPRPPVHRLELSDATGVDSAAAIVAPDLPAGMLTAPLIDPTDPAIVWIATRAADGGPAELARLDLRARQWQVLAAGCPAGDPIAVVATRTVVACATAERAIAIRASRRDGTRVWDWATAGGEGGFGRVSTAGDAIALASGDRTVVLDAATGAVIQDHRADDGGTAFAAAVRVGAASAVASIERGAVVTRALAAPLAPLWAAAPRGTVVGLTAAGADLVAVLDAGDAYRLDLATGAARPLAAAAERWSIAGDLVVGEAALDDGWSLRAFDRTHERFRIGVATDGPFALAVRGPDPAAPVALVHGVLPAAVVLDPATGQIMRHVALSERTTDRLVFTTVVDGQPVAGAVLFGPLAALVF